MQGEKEKIRRKRIIGGACLSYFAQI